ncbi:hypothetical protein ACDI16_14365 [Oceanobacillus caeni]
MNYYDPYHYYDYDHSQYHDDERQFNLPWYILNQMFPNQGGFPGTGPGFPGGGFPGTGPGFPGGGSPGGPGQFPGQPGTPGQGGQAGPPTAPPPNFTPQQSQTQVFAVDPGGIRGCLFRLTYVWLRRDAFWYYPTFVGRRSIAGFRWNGWRWVYFGIDLDHIQSFQCF